MANKKLDKKDYSNLRGQAQYSDINQNHLILSFIDFNFDPQIITDKLQLKPHSIGKKDEVYFVGPNKQVQRIRECNHWEFEHKVISNQFIGDLANDFFNEVIKPRIELIKDLNQNCETLKLGIVQYYYTGHNPGFGLTKEQINILAEINAEVDIDLYCLCEDK